MLTFDEAAHRYYWHGQWVPNVTSILKPLTDYSMIPPAVLEHARQQGVAVHKMVDLHCRNDLDEATLPEWMTGHFAAWKRFLAESRFEVWGSERRLFHPKMCYAGTLDLIGIFRDGDYAGEPSIIDIKRSLFAGPVIGLQLSGYMHAWNDSLKVGDARKVSGRYALQLRDNGTYRLEPFEDKGDWATFVAMLTQWRWKHKHGYFEKEAA